MKKFLFIAAIFMAGIALAQQGNQVIPTSASGIGGTIAATQLAGGTGANAIGPVPGWTFGTITGDDINCLANDNCSELLTDTEGDSSQLSAGDGSYTDASGDAVDFFPNELLLGNASAGARAALSQDASGNLDISTPIVVTGAVTADSYSTTVNCKSAASPAACTTASAGSVVVAASATTVVVDSSAVTANSEILVTFDSSLGTALSVTCNVTEPALYGVSARSAGVSFTLSSTSPSVNPACFNYLIIN